MKNAFIWLAGILALILLLGSFFVRDYLNCPNEADMLRILGFICLIFFTVYKFRGDDEEK